MLAKSPANFEFSHGISFDDDIASLRGGLTYREIAVLEGISAERVYQIELRALGKLRHAFQKLGINSFDGRVD